MDGYGYRFFLYSDFRRTTDLRFLIGYPLDHYTYPLIFLLTRSLTHPLTPISSLFTSHFSLSTSLLFSHFIYFYFHFSLSLSLSLTRLLSPTFTLTLSLFSVLSPASLSFTVTISLSTHNHGLTKHHDYDGIFSTEWSKSIQARSCRI